METTEYKQRLEAEKVKLEGELASVGRRNPDNKGDWETAAPEEMEADPNDTATNMSEFGVNDAILTDLEKRLADVNDALARIENGSYGKCEVSGEAIEEDRLNADPAARTCKEHMS
ncbi:MAG TPA: TraR/DksA C4-type zinc finger protein [Candidatus Paceibacterota bacterium]|nr:TraR/DksA C4-type zinc finger protein [Candidatus Paceibacterota bacterium]